jgi:hypothetical protein
VWRYILFSLLVVSFVSAEDVLLFGSDESVLLTNFQLVVSDATFTVDAVNPANNTPVDRDSFDPTDADVIMLTANVPLIFPNGTSIAFMANLTAPTISGQTSLVLGYNNTTSGVAVLYYNPNSTTFAGNYTWYATAANAISNEVRTTIVTGSYSMLFHNLTLNPNSAYFQNESVTTDADLVSNGPESRAQLNETYNALVNARITNTTGDNALVGLTFLGGLWSASYPLLTLKGVGVWNNTLLSSLQYFYTPAPVYREFSVYDYMNVTSNAVTPSPVNTLQETTAACRVLDQRTGAAVTAGNVSFYANNTFLGVNLTNTTGYATLTFALNTTGVYTVTCSISDQLDIFYYKGSEPERNSTLTVLSTPPVFTGVVDDTSNSSDPTNEGTVVRFNASATDANGDNWYLLICESLGESNGNCIGTELCRSTNIASASQANCNISTTGLANEEYGWHAYACDSNSRCGSVENSSAPFWVNHAPVTTPSITPSPAYVNDTLTCNPLNSDSDSGDTVNNTFVWFRQNEGSGSFSGIAGETAGQLTNTSFDSNDRVYCQVVPTDNHNFSGNAVNSISVTVQPPLLDATASLNQSTVLGGSSVLLYANCTATRGDAEAVTLVVQDNRTGSYTQMSTSPAAVYANVSSIALGRLASQTSSTYTVRIFGQTTANYSIRVQCQAIDASPVQANSTPLNLEVQLDYSAPALLNVLVQDVTDRHATLNWSTDDYSTSVVNYGTSNPPGSSIVNPALTQTHLVLLSALSGNTLYYYNVTSCNGDNFCNTTPTSTFTTDPTDVGNAVERGVYTIVVVERGPNYREGYISKGDVIEFRVQMPHEVRERETVTITLTNADQQIRQSIHSPAIIEGSEVPLYP